MQNGSKWASRTCRGTSSVNIRWYTRISLAWGVLRYMSAMHMVAGCYYELLASACDRFWFGFLSYPIVKLCWICSSKVQVTKLINLSEHNYVRCGPVAVIKISMELNWNLVKLQNENKSIWVFPLEAKIFWQRLEQGLQQWSRLQYYLFELKSLAAQRNEWGCQGRHARNLNKRTQAASRQAQKFPWLPNSARDCSYSPLPLIQNWDYHPIKSRYG